MNEMTTKRTWYYEEYPLNTVMAAEKRIDSLLLKAELDLVVSCASQCTAYTELNGKNGVRLYVARKKKYDSEHGCYAYDVQLLDDELRVLESVHYRQAASGDAGFGISEYVRCEDGYSVEPLMHLALTVLRKTSR